MVKCFKRVKEKDMEFTKLNLGSGDNPLPDYENWDIKEGHEAYPLDEIEDGSLDEIRASHILEHFSYHDTSKVLENWVSKLKIGGVLKIAVPDSRMVAQKYIEGDRVNTSRIILGGQLDEYDYHKAMFDEPTLRAYMMQVGLSNITRWESAIEDCARLNVSLNLQGTKADDGIISCSAKYAVVMSMPRLAFTDNMVSLVLSFPRGTPMFIGQGVFWEQVLTCRIEEALKMKPDYIVTVDYDTWFRQEHFFKLAELMELYPFADAIFPNQIKRENSGSLFGIPPEEQKKINEMIEAGDPIDLIEGYTGHFGLTIFRARSLELLKKPWIWGQPGPDKRWDENRLDPDIYFWHNFRECGFRAFWAPYVHVGHLQMMCTFPGPDFSKQNPVYMHLGALNRGDYPYDIIPKVGIE